MTFRRRTRRLVALVLCFALVVAACSSDDGGSVSPDDRTTSTPSGATPTTGPGAAEPAERRCDQGATTARVEARPVTEPGQEHDWTITSFDGTEIRAHWFPVAGADAESPVPTVLMGPGWSLAGDTSQTGDALFGGMSIPSLNGAGYNVLTWDPRGFGQSTGAVQVDGPETEGRDVQRLLDWVAEQPQARTDRPGDPRVAMVGASYGGGIQMTTAAIDCRIDVLVPTIAWNSLETSLYKNGAVKIGWAGDLIGVANGHDLDPHITDAFQQGQATGTISPDDLEWFRSRGPGAMIDQVEVPTLFIQGTVDTLFTLDEAITNHASLRQRAIPTAMLWFCGGHGACLTDAGDPKRIGEATFAWLSRYLDEDQTVDTGPAFSTVDQEGTTWTDADYPVATQAELKGSGAGTLELTDGGGAGPVQVPSGKGGPLGGLVASITPAPADRAVEVDVETGEVDGLALGAPVLTVTYTGTAPAGDRPGRLFAQLVDTERQVVVGNQITPIPLELDGAEHTASFDLEVIAQRVRRGQRLTLQLVATTVAYAPGQLGGSVDLSDIQLTIPVVTKGLTEGGAIEG